MTLNLPVRSLYQRPPLVSLQCLCPDSPSGSSCTASTSTSGTDSSSSSETSSESSSQPSSNASSPETSQFSQYIAFNITRTASDGALFQQPACGHKRSSKPSSDEKPNGQLERPTATYRRAEASCQSAAEPTAASLSASSSKYATSTVSPKTSQVTRGLRNRCRQRMPMFLVRAVTQRQTDYRTFKKSPVDA